MASSSSNSSISASAAGTAQSIARGCHLGGAATVPPAGQWERSARPQGHVAGSQWLDLASEGVCVAGVIHVCEAMEEKGTSEATDNTK